MNTDFIEQDNFHIWSIIFIDEEPLMENITNTPEFKEFENKITKKFWANHDHIKAEFELKGLL